MIKVKARPTAADLPNGYQFGAASRCVCVDGEIELFGSPDPLCVATRHNRSPARWRPMHQNAAEQITRNGGVLPGSPLAVGAGQTGKTIATHGWSAKQKR